MGRKGQPRERVMWAIWLGAYPMCIGYTRKQAIATFMREIVGSKYTWDDMKKGGYSLVKTTLNPTESPKS